MNLINWLLSGLFVPKSQYEKLQILAKAYLDQAEDLKTKLSRDEDRWRSLEKDLAKNIEVNRLFASKIECLGKLLLDEGFSSEEIETDEFYDRLKFQALNLYKTRIGYYFCQELIKKISAIALSNGDLENEEGIVGQVEVDLILEAIADLRGKVADLSEENASLKEKEKSLIESLQLSQNEVCVVADKLTLLENILRGSVANMQSALAKV